MASTEHPVVGWIGLGSMGMAMARNIQKFLQREGRPQLRYWNRTASRGEPLKSLGGIGCESIVQLVAECDLIFISTSDDAALIGIVDQILSAEDIDGKIIVDTTTVHANTTKETNEKLKSRGASLIAAPVFGATPAAESGTVLMGMAGPKAAIEIVSPFVKGVLASQVMVVSEQPQKASLLKTLGNFIIAGMMETIGEAQVFAEKSELGTATLEKLLELNFGSLMHSTSTRMTQGVYLPGEGESPWSSLELGIKDVQHGVTSAQDAGMRLKVAEVALENMTRAKTFADAHGGRSLDSSAGYGIIRQDAGLEFENTFVKERDSAKETGGSQ
ncbi:uncharacterized protein N7515_001646 [Penicillium bovifimosum]|uniref:6-phosphogluconate dehydrogenase NADP-binding domain-containing protein n=1 Tax=Penicillium bovifimosum TaxID=126998 RepID=A0A9W9L8W6_9EURO|nr:uncharacterized protein N7515_001646 [Penicillium bovifimosum]KAJ5142859.1 hypothetical protein N7515_001646 [Penicillium bovifimosum]